MNFRNKPFIAALLFSLIICSILLISAHSIIMTHWENPYLFGWDGEGHAAIGQYYSEHIFPSLYGWASPWYGGIPFPQFYPPLFYVCMALLARIFFWISYISLFKFVVMMLSLCIPTVISWFTFRRTKNYFTSVISGVFATILVLSSSSTDALGMDFKSSVGAGMMTQQFAFLLFIVWFDFLLHKKWWKATGMLALVALANVHIVPVLLVIYAVTFFVEVSNRTSAGKRSKIFFVYVISGLLSIGLTACWLVPLITSYDFFVTKALTPHLDFFRFNDLFLFFFITILSVVIAAFYKRKDLLIFSISSLVIILTNFITWPSALSGYPLHIVRWLGPFYILMTYMIAECIQVVGERYTLQKKYKIYIVVGVSIIFAIYGDWSIITKPQYNAQPIPEIQGILQSLDMSRRTVVEHTVYPNIPTGFVMDEMIGLQGGEAATIIFRESSINSFFYTPVRNSFSTINEIWGFDSYIAEDNDYMIQPGSTQISRAEELGISQFVVRSKKAKDMLDRDPRVTHVKDVSLWSIYKTKNPSPDKERLEYLPVPVYASYGFKNRKAYSYDWTRLQEERLFWNDSTQFIYPKDQNLDTSPELSELPVIFISSYQYHDMNKALERLKAVSASSTIYAVESTDPLFDKIVQTIPQEKLHVILSIPDNIEIIKQTKAVRTNLGNMFSSIHQYEQKQGTTTNYTRFRMTYFPAWTNAYLASPAFMITKDGSNPLWKTPRSVYVGYGISVIALFIWGIWAYFTYRNYDPE